MRPVVFDSAFLVAAVETEVLPPGAPNGIKFRHLLRELERQKTRILIPTPVLAEVLVKRTSERARLIQMVQRSSRLIIGEFGAAAAAVSAELMSRKWPKPKERDEQWSRHRLKFDLQILAIAQVNNAATVYTNDTDLAKHCRSEGLAAVSFGELPMPAESQTEMQLAPPGQHTGEASAGIAGSPPLAAAAQSPEAE